MNGIYRHILGLVLYQMKEENCRQRLVFSSGINSVGLLDGVAELLKQEDSSALKSVQD